VDAPPAH